MLRRMRRLLISFAFGKHSNGGSPRRRESTRASSTSRSCSRTPNPFMAPPSGAVAPWCEPSWPVWGWWSCRCPTGCGDRRFDPSRGFDPSKEIPASLVYLDWGESREGRLTTGDVRGFVYGLAHLWVLQWPDEVYGLAALKKVVEYLWELTERVRVGSDPEVAAISLGQ